MVLTYLLYHQSARLSEFGDTKIDIIYIGEVISEKICNDKITCLKWKDKRIVHMLSTFHGDDMIDKRRRTRKADGGVEVIKKPLMVDDYNRHMGGVDRSDQLILYYGYPHRYIQ